MPTIMPIATRHHKQPDGTYVMEHIWSDVPCVFNRQARYSISETIGEYMQDKKAEPEEAQE